MKLRLRTLQWQTCNQTKTKMNEIKISHLKSFHRKDLELYTRTNDSSLMNHFNYFFFNSLFKSENLIRFSNFRTLEQQKN